MCVSADYADFRGTIVYAGRRNHPRLGRIEVLGYQNTALNLAAGPNAMLLHLPAAGVGPEHFVDVGRHADVLTRMSDALTPVSASADGMDWMEQGTPPQVHVFEHDVYTVVLAEDPMRVYAALERVPPHRRPRVSPELFEFYATAFPGHAVALCCFDNRDARRAKPLLLWYEPRDPSRLVVPAIDCHTGGVPRLGSPVGRDHLVVFGVDDEDVADDWGLGPEHLCSAVMQWPGGMRHQLREFLPDRVVGVRIGDLDRPDLLANGDFAIDHAALLADDGLTRLGSLRLITP
ncbi:hypothetical protein [Catellatospora vulcania]|uniref:hypothetical protein n=1 Tax=Catellatospora vulcania TaxID=1460450 RepID=UPI0012D436B3|nr:hypothetical protein [Catellatospora vulcania]